MSDQLSAKDWLDQGLKALAANGVTALKAEPLAKAMGVSRDLEADSANENPLVLLLRRTFSSRLTLEKAVRSWATFDVEARSAVQAIDRRRVDYIASRLMASGIAEDIAQARAQILYWAFVGYALSDKPLPRVRQEGVLDELVRIALQN